MSDERRLLSIIHVDLANGAGQISVSVSAESWAAIASDRDWVFEMIETALNHAKGWGK